MRLRSIAMAAVVAAGCERAPDSRESGAIGWQPARLGMRWDTQLTTVDRGHRPEHPDAAFDARHTTRSHFEVLTVEGERIAKLRFVTTQDDRVVNGRPGKSLTGTFIVSGTVEHPEITKENGVLLAGEPEALLKRYQPYLSDPAPRAALGRRVFRLGEHYVVPEDLLGWFRAAPGDRVELVSTAITTKTMTFALTTEMTATAPKLGYARGHCTGTWEIELSDLASDVHLDCRLDDSHGAAWTSIADGTARPVH